MMPTTINADSRFQLFIQTFADAFGIVNPGELETQKREIVPESVEIDTVVAFPDDFDFTTLQDRIFPFFGQENVIEYKGKNDALSLMRFYQYSLTELGILTTHLLSKIPEEKIERRPLTQKVAKQQWIQLTEQGATHSCTAIIISTTDPSGFREAVGFKPVDEYDHLVGALYRWTIAENEFLGSIATYLVVLNNLPLHPKNAPLLLLSTGKKQVDFFQWLFEEHEGMTSREKERCLYYLLKYDLVQNQEILQKMQMNTQPKHDDLGYFLDLFAQEPDEEKRIWFFESVLKRFVQVGIPVDITQRALQADSAVEASQKLLQANSPSEASQKLLQANSPSEASQKLLQAESPSEASQKLLQANSPEEAALKLVQSEEQVERLLELIRQRDGQKARTTEAST